MENTSSTQKASKIAIVLMNLGGPDSQADVQSFLFNLFNDKSIISLPQPFRWCVAKLISVFRAKMAKKNYALMGGGSPLLSLTNKQAEALEKLLEKSFPGKYKVYISMRYWYPRAQEVIKHVAQNADIAKVILLPLYPQYSTATTASSFQEWDRLSEKLNLKIPIRKICCYPTHALFIKAHVNLILDNYQELLLSNNVRLLFSAHGIPESLVVSGDPYQHHVALTVAAIMQQIQKTLSRNLDYIITYQSKVGPLKWLTPSTKDEIIRAGHDNKNVLIVPVAFVSEHIETLVELDIEYRHIALANNVLSYNRVPALNNNPFFIKALAQLCENEEICDCCNAKNDKCYLRSIGKSIS